jgi:hypothetical protein
MVMYDKLKNFGKIVKLLILMIIIIIIIITTTKFKY